MRRDMTGSYQHLRSYAAPTLYQALTHVDATLRTLALSMTMEWGPGPFCPTVDVGGRPAERVRRLRTVVAERQYLRVGLTYRN